MKRLFFLFSCFFAILAVCRAQSDSPLSLDVFMERTFMLGEWSPDKRLSDPLISGSTDLAVRINFNTSRHTGLWGQLSMVFGHGSRIEPGSNYLSMFHNVSMDNYYLLDSESAMRINYVPSMRASAGVLLALRRKKWTFTPCAGGGFESLNTPKVSYTLKEKGTNNVNIFSYTWGGYNPLCFLAYVSGEAKLSYALYPTMNVFAGVVYRCYLSKPEFRITQIDYYREQNKDVLSREITKGNLVNSLGISIGVTFR